MLDFTFGGEHGRDRDFQHFDGPRHEQHHASA